MLLCGVKTDAQIISTFAGNGMLGHTGDGGPATAAKIIPEYLALDGFGNIYISEGYYIRKINPSGIITTIAGTGTGGFTGDGGLAVGAMINNVWEIASDATGNVYIADHNNSRIRKINTSGIITTIAGNGAGYSGDLVAATATGVGSPTGVAVDGAGNIYIASPVTERVRKVNTLGIITTIAGTGTSGVTGDGGPATAAEIYNPEAVWADALGNVYFVENCGCRIRKIDTSGIITTVAGNGTAGYYGNGIPCHHC